MAVNSATSFVLSSITMLLLFSGMQMYKPLLVRSPLAIIFGGYLGSLIFMFFVTAVGNLQAAFLGRNFQLKLPEIVVGMIAALIAAGMIHRICLTTCMIFSLITIYYMNKISQKTYGAPLIAPVPVKTRRHK